MVAPKPTLVVVARTYAGVHSRVRVILIFCRYVYIVVWLVRSIFPLHWFGFAQPSVKEKAD